MIYFISGLGADERVFQYLNLSDVEHKFIKWVDPEPNDSLNNYCKKLLPQIDLTAEVKLVGISFGGIIALELAKIIPCKKIIIISSVKTKFEFSWQIKLARKFQLHRVLPQWFIVWSNLLTANYFFGIETKAESELLHQIIKDTDPKFLKWAMNQIVNWDNADYPKNLVHIHGTKDRIFPISYVNNAIEIPNGGHFMIVNKVQQLEQLIFEALTYTL